VAVPSTMSKTLTPQCACMFLELITWSDPTACPLCLQNYLSTENDFAS